MATTSKGKQPLPKFDFKKLFGTAGHGAEIARRQQVERAGRSSAATAEKILSPTEVAGEYDPVARQLMTTLGGKLRPVTREDLIQFERLVGALEKKFQGGITAQSAINLSRKDDIERANEQIHIAVIRNQWTAGAKAGTLLFVTNSGPDSKVPNHHVHVRLSPFDWPKYVATPAKKGDTKKLAADLLKRPLQFECDCEHFRYTFRYIATAGKFVHGRAENGYPKYRNPNLTGVCCKHLLRVMREITHGAYTKVHVAKMLDQARSRLVDTTPIKVTAAEAKEIAQKQAEAARKGLVGATVETAQQAKERRTQAKKTPAAMRREAERVARQAAKEAEAKVAAEYAEQMKALLMAVPENLRTAVMAHVRKSQGKKT